MDNYTFDDVLIKPKFSTVKSRKDVDVSSPVFGLKIPIFSANMDSITEAHMCKTLATIGAGGVLHRFWDVETNIRDYLKLSEYERQFTSVSIGLGKIEVERFEALKAVGASRVFIDVAHGASMQVAEQYNLIKSMDSNIEVIVGNFATGETIKHFREYCNTAPFAFKVGVGGSKICSTRLVTGVGMPQLSAISDCVNTSTHYKLTIIADGGISKAADVCKALGAGASAVMMGSMLAGTTETPGNLTYTAEGTCKVYRGSASQESYQKQGKVASWRAAEGVSKLVPYKGTVIDVINKIEGGIRSSYSYVNAYNLEQFHNNVEFVKVTNSTVSENKTYV